MDEKSLKKEHYHAVYLLVSSNFLLDNETGRGGKVVVFKNKSFHDKEI